MKTKNPPRPLTPDELIAYHLMRFRYIPGGLGLYRINNEFQLESLYMQRPGCVDGFSPSKNASHLLMVQEHLMKHWWARFMSFKEAAEDARKKLGNDAYASAMSVSHLPQNSFTCQIGYPASGGRRVAELDAASISELVLHAAVKVATQYATKRIQHVRCQKLPEGAKMVCRPSKYGNPCKVGPDISVEDAVDAFKVYLFKHQTLLTDAFSELRGKDLACYCPVGSFCHGDILLTKLNNNKQK